VSLPSDGLNSFETVLAPRLLRADGNLFATFGVCDANLFEPVNQTIFYGVPL